VYFNAWKYAETPLRRHFLTRAALGLGASKSYSERLYSRSRKTKYSLTRRTIASIVGAGALVSATSVGVVASIKFVVWVLSDRSSDFWGDLSTAISNSAGELLISAAIFTPAIAFVMSQMKVDVAESEPSSAEQFETLFEQLVDKRLAAGHIAVFFIDELDRAPVDQMKAVMETLKTFLDHPKCVFIVAADQVVLERAVAQSPELSAPVRGNAYYSSGSAYLDKVFQYQLHLPAVEAPLLTRFAVDLVSSRVGIWKLLGPDRDKVVSTLVPSHVRSPRRVKVLLNGFVLTTRAATRRIQSDLNVSDYLQLAKLTCLRIEFPLFYREVEEIPILVDVLTALIVNDEDRLRDYAAYSDVLLAARGYVEGSNPVDVVLDAAPTTAQTARDLVDYLRRTQSTQLRDLALVFQRPPGSDVGLDPSIARSVEQAARDASPDRAVELAKASDPEVLGRIIRMLARTIDEAVGIEIDNTIAVTFGVIEVSASRFDNESAQTALASFDRLEVWSRIAPEHVPAYLQVASKLDEAARTAREKAIIGRSEESAEWGLAVIRSFQHIGPRSASDVHNLTAKFIRSDPNLVKPVLADLPDDVFASLWTDALGASLTQILTNESQLLPRSVELAQDVLSRVAPAARWTVFVPTLIKATKARLDELSALYALVPPVETPDQASAILEAVATDPRLGILLERLGDVPASKSATSKAIVSLVGWVSEDGAALPAAESHVQHLGPSLRNASLSGRVVVGELEESIWPEDWTSDPADRSRLHRVLVAIARADTTHSPTWLSTVAESIEAIAASAPLTQEVRDEIVDQCGDWSPAFRPDTAALNSLFEAFSVARPTVPGERFSPATRRYCRSLVAYALHTLSPDQLQLLRSDLATDDVRRSSVDAASLGIYLLLARPAVDSGEEAIVAGAQLAGDPLFAGYAKPYFEALSQTDALALISLLYESGLRVPQSLLTWIKPQSNQLAWARTFGDLLRAATTREDRAAAWSLIASLQIDNPSAQKVVRAIAFEKMTTSAGSLDDFLVELPNAFPGWSPSKKEAKTLNDARKRLEGRHLRRKALNILESIARRKTSE
jgi:hypothetical protein